MDQDGWMDGWISEVEIWMINKLVVQGMRDVRLMSSKFK